jgi:hypothetical protein
MSESADKTFNTTRYILGKNTVNNLTKLLSDFIAIDLVYVHLFQRLPHTFFFSRFQSKI